jgi:hypothetical protein
MRMRKRAKGGRAPHPDARVEAELQKILMLRRMADGHEAQIRRYVSVTNTAQAAISEAVASHSLGPENYSHISAEQMKQVVETSERRITTAEGRIAELRGAARCTQPKRQSASVSVRCIHFR